MSIAHTIRRRVLPWAVWLATVAAVIYLWRDVGGGGQVLGFARGVDYRVAALQAARVQGVAVTPGQQVTAGRLLATLDTSDLDARRQTLTAELARLDADLVAARAAAEADSAALVARLSGATDVAARALAQAQARRRTLRARRDALAARLKTQRDLTARHLAPRDRGDRLAADLAVARQEAAAAAAQVTLLTAQRDAAQARQEAAVAGASGRLDAAQAPLRAQRAVLQTRLDALQARVAQRTLRAPAAGRVTAVLKRPGDVANPGDPVVTLVATTADRVIACVPETRSTPLAPGAAAELRPRYAPGGRPLRGHVASLGAQVAPLPPRCQPNPRRVAWGREAIILLDQPAPLVPGQAFAVRLDDGSKAPAVAPPRAHAASPPVTPPGTPQPIAPPPVLRAMTAFEPSGIVWVPERARYLMVSDDTGTDRDDTDHAPWLFTLRDDGAADPAPLPMAGLNKVNDLESIARTPDGALYVLSSQSFNKHGKRKPSRQVFARLRWSDRQLRADGVVRLASLLEAAPAASRAALGLSDLRALDIEGLTAAPASLGGGLLVGLKGPLTSDGRALVWHMAHPDRLVQTGRLEDAGLTLWATARLTVRADGRDVPGGVAELLVLPTGALVLSSTAATTADGHNPDTQDGALWVVEAPLPGPARQAGGAAAAPTLTARRFRVFPGGKPEGLSLAPAVGARAGQLMVVFDEGGSGGSWVRLPWPR